MCFSSSSRWQLDGNYVSRRQQRMGPTDGNPRTNACNSEFVIKEWDQKRQE